MFFGRIPLRLLLLLVLAIFCTVSADQTDLISSSDELINGPEEKGSPQYRNPGSWMPTPSEADITDVGILPSMMVDGSAGTGQAENTINAIDNCANAPKNSRRGVQLRKKRQLPEWCDNKQNPAPSSTTSGDSDGTNSAPTLENPITKPVLKPKPASDSQQPTTEAEESKMKDLQQVFLRLGGGGICNTELEYFRYQYPVCFPYAMGGRGRPFALNRASWRDMYGLTLESGYLRKDIFPCRQTLIPECYSDEEFWCCEEISQLPDPVQIERTGQLSSPDMLNSQPIQSPIPLEEHGVSINLEVLLTDLLEGRVHNYRIFGLCRFLVAPSRYEER